MEVEVQWGPTTLPPDTKLNGVILGSTNEIFSRSFLYHKNEFLGLLIFFLDITGNLARKNKEPAACFAEKNSAKSFPHLLFYFHFFSVAAIINSLYY